MEGALGSYGANVTRYLDAVEPHWCTQYSIILMITLEWPRLFARSPRLQDFGRLLCDDIAPFLDDHVSL